MPPCQSRLENDNDIEAAILTYIPAGADPNHCVKMLQQVCCSNHSSTAYRSLDLCVRQCTDAACSTEDPSHRARRENRRWLRRTAYLFATAFLLALALLGLHRKGVFHVAWEIGVYITRVLFKACNERMKELSARLSDDARIYPCILLVLRSSLLIVELNL